MKNNCCWDDYVNHVLDNNYEAKFHLHLDAYFSFKDGQQKVKAAIFPLEGDKLKGFSFLPLLKTINNTPRLKFLEIYEKYVITKKKRPIFLTGHFDKYIYGYYSYYLNRKYQEFLSDKKFNKCPIAYRDDLHGNCNIQFAKEVFDFIKTKENCGVIITDVSSFFDNIDHSILKSNWKKVMGIIDTDPLPTDHFKVFNALTKYRYIGFNSFLKNNGIDLKRKENFKGSLLELMKIDNINSFNAKMKYLNDQNLIVKNKPDSLGKLKGIPQGLSISATLSNIYMLQFDKKMDEYATARNGLYRRYCDDIILIIPNSDLNEELRYVKAQIEDEMLMQIKAKKTELAYFRNNECQTFDVKNFEHFQFIPTKRGKIQYLGFTFDGTNTLIRSSSISRYYRKMSRRIRKTIRMSYSKNAK